MAADWQSHSIMRQHSVSKGYDPCYSDDLARERERDPCRKLDWPPAQGRHNDIDDVHHRRRTTYPEHQNRVHRQERPYKSNYSAYNGRETYHQRRDFLQRHRQQGHCDEQSGGFAAQATPHMDYRAAGPRSGWKGKQSYAHSEQVQTEASGRTLPLDSSRSGLREQSRRSHGTQNAYHSQKDPLRPQKGALTRTDDGGDSYSALNGEAEGYAHRKRRRTEVERTGYGPLLPYCRRHSRKASLGRSSASSRFASRSPSEESYGSPPRGRSSDIGSPRSPPPQPPRPPRPPLYNRRSYDLAQPVESGSYSSRSRSNSPRPPRPPRMPRRKRVRGSTRSGSASSSIDGRPCSPPPRSSSCTRSRGYSSPRDRKSRFLHSAGGKSANTRLPAKQHTRAVRSRRSHSVPSSSDTSSSSTSRCRRRTSGSSSSSRERTFSPASVRRPFASRIARSFNDLGPPPQPPRPPNLPRFVHPNRTIESRVPSRPRPVRSNGRDCQKLSTSPTPLSPPLRGPRPSLSGPGPDLLQRIQPREPSDSRAPQPPSSPDAIPPPPPPTTSPINSTVPPPPKSPPKFRQTVKPLRRAPGMPPIAPVAQTSAGVRRFFPGDDEEEEEPFGAPKAVTNDAPKPASGADLIPTNAEYAPEPANMEAPESISTQASKPTSSEALKAFTNGADKNNVAVPARMPPIEGFTGSPASPAVKASSPPPPSYLPSNMKSPSSPPRQASQRTTSRRSSRYPPSRETAHEYSVPGSYYPNRDSSHPRKKYDYNSQRRHGDLKPCNRWAPSPRWSQNNVNRSYQRQGGHSRNTNGSPPPHFVHHEPEGSIHHTTFDGLPLSPRQECVPPPVPSLLPLTDSNTKREPGASTRLPSSPRQECLAQPLPHSAPLTDSRTKQASPCGTPIPQSILPLPDASVCHVDEQRALPTSKGVAVESTSMAAGNSLEDREVYERLAQVGEGTYGKVYKARNVESGQLVAMKRIRMEAERDGFPITAIREVKLLQGLHHQNIVNLVEMVVSKGHVYIVFEYMDHDLSGVLHHPSINFTEAHIKSLMWQLMAGLQYMHEAGVLHRDLKGSNILLNKLGELKIADFGLARRYERGTLPGREGRGKGRDYTNRVITLWYKPPELLFGATVYGEEVDIWSAGAIFLELFTRRPIFQASDEIDQLHATFKLMGTPNECNWPNVSSLPWYELVKPKFESSSRLRETFFGDDKHVKTESGMRLAERLLTLCPDQRPSAREAMMSPYFTEDEPAMQLPTEPLSKVKGEWHELESKRARKRRDP